MEKFDVVFRGYDKEQVTKALDGIIKNYEVLLNKSKATETENLRLLSKLEHYEKLESTLNKAIFTAEETCEKIRTLARQEADSMLQEARRNSNRIINDALMKAEKAEDDIERLRRNVRFFKKRLKTIVESQLQVIDEIEDIDLNKYE